MHLIQRYSFLNLKLSPMIKVTDCIHESLCGLVQSVSRPRLVFTNPQKRNGNPAFVIRHRACGPGAPSESGESSGLRRWSCPAGRTVSHVAASPAHSGGHSGHSASRQRSQTWLLTAARALNRRCHARLSQGHLPAPTQRSAPRISSFCSGLCVLPARWSWRVAWGE